MNPMPASRFRKRGKLFTAIFVGEHSQDAGGPYRQTFSTMAQELETPSLPLLLPTPNGIGKIGRNRERWLLHPRAADASATQRDMLGFVGKLMGFALRNEEFLPLSLAPLTWKALVGETPLSLDDLAGVDQALVASMERLRHIERDGVTEEMFESIIFESFDTLSTDGRRVELEPGGADRAVTWATRAAYADAVLEFRLREFEPSAAAARRGLAATLPLPLLSLFTGSQFETLVCGEVEVDLALLRRCTRYESCEEGDAHVGRVWEVLEKMDQDDRRAFLRFVWGRSRLPLNEAGFVERFKIQRFGRAPADRYFPVAHTCFFALELPAYSSAKLMRERLRYAMYNCESIDGDATDVGDRAAAMGQAEDWDVGEDDEEED